MPTKQTNETQPHAANRREAVEKTHHKREEVLYYDVETSEVRKVQLNKNPDRIAAEEIGAKIFADIAKYGAPPLIYVSKLTTGGLPGLTESPVYQAFMEERRKRPPNQGTKARSSLAGEVRLGSPDQGREELAAPATIRRQPNRDWTRVAIHLLANDIISYSVNGGKPKRKPLNDTMFVDGRNKGTAVTNQAFETLVGLTISSSFGAGRHLSGKDKARKSKLTQALIDLVGVEGRPFSERSTTEGYRRHFTVVDKRQDAAQRTERDFEQSEYVEEYHDENDPYC